MSQQRRTDGLDDASSPWRDEDGAARYSGRIPATSFKKWRAEGKGPKYYVVGRRVLYHIRDLDAFLSREVRQTADTIDGHSPPRRGRSRAA